MWWGGNISASAYPSRVGVSEVVGLVTFADLLRSSVRLHIKSKTKTAYCCKCLCGRGEATKMSLVCFVNRSYGQQGRDKVFNGQVCIES